MRPHFAEIVLLPFHISYHIGKAFVFYENKTEGNNQKVEIKYRVLGLGVSEQLCLFCCVYFAVHSRECSRCEK